MWASGSKASGGISAASQTIVRTTGGGMDWDETGLIKDGAYHDLDVSGIVPAGTIQVQFRLRLYDASRAYLVFYMKKKGEGNGSIVVSAFAYTIGLQYDYSFWLSVDADRIVEYNAQAGAWSMIELVIKAWTVAAT